MKSIAILGSTGSIGTQTLDVVRKNPERFRVVALVAGSNAERLAQQVDEFRPAFAALVAGDSPPGSGWATGPEALLEAATLEGADTVLNAVVGSRGLPATLAALDAGKTLALANKESLVAGGDLVMDRVRDDPMRMVPVDSEHSALAQCLAAAAGNRPRRVVITASGGPFRGRSADQMRNVTIDEALAHPTWRMGRKITIDSATLMNKGLEAIEAHHLSGLPIDQVEIVVHPQSILHGAVEFEDGSSIAQLSRPDMRLPIQVALAWPERLAEGAEPLDWQSLGALTFEPVDHDAFSAVGLAYEAARRGSTFPAVLNAANEEAVEAFLGGRLDFLGIVRVVEETLGAHSPPPQLTVEGVMAAEAWARDEARRLIGDTR